jgi:hypothetical protein
MATGQFTKYFTEAFLNLYAYKEMFFGSKILE